MSLFDKTLRSRPYVVEFKTQDGKVEVKVDAYDAEEAMLAGILQVNSQHGDDPTREVSGVRPNIDKLRETETENSVVKIIIDSVSRARKKRTDGEEKA